MKTEYAGICEDILKSDSRNPVTVAEAIMKKNPVPLHGPLHHFLDGAAFLAACRNSGMETDLEQALEKLALQAEKIPGAICGNWGICGAVASVGAAMSVLHGTGPLSDNSFYKDHMEYTSRVLAAMSGIGGPRCCKRNAFLALETAALFMNEKYGIPLETAHVKCTFYGSNRQCIRSRCPFFPL